MPTKENQHSVIVQIVKDKPPQDYRVAVQIVDCSKPEPRRLVVPVKSLTIDEIFRLRK
jgi:hypothetical protein